MRLKAERGALDRSMTKWFHVDRPPSDPDRPNSRPTQDATRWWVEGETYPTLSMLACRGLAHSHLGDDMAAALYEMWSGFSHPSVFFGKVHRGPEDEGVVTFTYRYADLEEAVRYAVLTLLDGIRHWVTYYGAQPQSTLDCIDAITDRLDALSALSDEHRGH